MNKEDENIDNELWSLYVEGHKQPIPPGISEKVWAGIRRRKQKRQRIMIAASVAASLALLITFFVPANQEQSDAEKRRLLQEALSMFPEEEKTPNEVDIIYEDDMIIIYVGN
tara:strand:- start:271 stop:606 length:336 start_codon:yes stop_codon:yes gene_type:complete